VTGSVACAALIAWMLLRCARRSSPGCCYAVRTARPPLPNTNASGAEGQGRNGIDSLYSDAELEEDDIFVESDTG